MRYAWPFLVLLVIGCRPTAEDLATQAEIEERERVLAKTVMSLAPTKDEPYRIRFSAVPQTGTYAVAWADDRGQRAKFYVIDPVTRTASPPQGLDPRRPLTAVFDVADAGSRDFPVNFPAGPTNWPENEPSRTKDGAWSARLEWEIKDEQLKVVLDGPPPDPGHRRALAYRTIGRFCVCADELGELPYRMRDGELADDFDSGLFRSGDRIRVTGEIVEGATIDRRVVRPLSIKSEVSRDPKVRTVRLSSGDINLTDIAVDVPKNKDEILFAQYPLTKEWFASVATGGEIPTAKATVTKIDDRGRPTEATADVRLMRIVKRTPFDFLLEIP